MREVMTTAATVELAVEEALKQLNTSKNLVNVHVIEEGKKGIFGLFGSKPAIVRVTFLEDTPLKQVELSSQSTAVENDESIEDATKYITDILKQMEIDATVDVERDGRETMIRVKGKDAPAIIGRRGQTLNSLQYLMQLVANKKNKSYSSIILDVENYRKQRKETLIQLANRLSDRAVSTKRRVDLEPMPAYERKIIHTALSERNDIRTESQGDEPNRYLVIYPKR